MVLVRIITKVGVNTGPVKGHGMRQPLVPRIAAYRDWTGLAVEFSTKILVVFHLAEIRQHLRIGPFSVTPGGPVIIILRNAPVEHLPIDGTRPAGRLATWDGQPVLLRCELRHVAPVMWAIGGEPHIVAQLEVIGQVREVRVIRPGLQQEHRGAGVLGQAGRHDTPRGAGANDNDIVLHQVHSSFGLRRYKAGGASCSNWASAAASQALVRTTTTASAGRLHLTRAGVKRRSKASCASRTRHP